MVVDEEEVNEGLGSRRRRRGAWRCWFVVWSEAKEEDMEWVVDEVLVMVGVDRRPALEDETLISEDLNFEILRSFCVPFFIPGLLQITGHISAQSVQSMTGQIRTC